MRRFIPFSVLGLFAFAGCAEGTATAPEEGLRDVAARSTNQPPIAVVNLTLLGVNHCGPGACVYDYEYDSHQSYDPDGSIVSQLWVMSDGYQRTSASWEVSALRAYQSCTGSYKGKLIVTDNLGAADTTCFGYTPVN